MRPSGGALSGSPLLLVVASHRFCLVDWWSGVHSWKFHVLQYGGTKRPLALMHACSCSCSCTCTQTAEAAQRRQRVSRARARALISRRPIAFGCRALCSPAATQAAAEFRSLVLGAAPGAGAAAGPAGPGPVSVNDARGRPCMPGPALSGRTSRPSWAPRRPLFPSSSGALYHSLTTAAWWIRSRVRS